MKAFLWVGVVALMCSSAPAQRSRTPRQPGQTAPSRESSDDLRFRSIGPANMGGRVSDLAWIEPGKSFIATFGTGGAFVSHNLGTTFEPIFEHYGTASVGSVAIFHRKEGKPPVIWLGTGEGNGRNSSSWGDGVYKSEDGGATFAKVGLDATKDIPSVAVDPRDEKVCYAAALGHLWGRNAERGLYKTIDSGKTWKPSLQIDDKTGACQVVVDPQNPDHVFAAMYDRLRTPYGFTSGGPQGGIYRSLDAGKSWKKLTSGLPGLTGRIGLTIFPNDSKIVMAVVESYEGGPRNLDDNRSPKGGVFRSEDGGDSWQRVSVLAPRGFYFSKIVVDPNDSQRVYLLGWNVWASEDGGRTFHTGFNDRQHSDFHAALVDPKDHDHLITGSDGGLCQTFDHGKSWDHLNTLALGEFYNVSFDMDEPFYHVGGGLQDNGSWFGPSRTSGNVNGTGGITNGDWQPFGGGDGFHVAFDPSDPNYLYSESQGGEIGRLDLRTNIRKDIKPQTREGDRRDRFNWNTPFIVSPHDPKTLYIGSQYLYRLTERGDFCERISPDLTTHDSLKMDATGSSAETYCSIVSIAESPKKMGLLWVGSDDGLIHVSEDNGAHWKNVTPKAVDGMYVDKLVPSNHSATRCYAVIDGHRLDRYDPLILETDDLGKSWKEVTGNLPKGGGSRALCEDRTNPDVLYAGTETGIFLSRDRGAHWTKFGGNSLPTVSVQDIQQHPKTLDIVIATHGRSVYILDDARPLGLLTPEIEKTNFTLFPIQDTKPFVRGRRDNGNTNKIFVGENDNLGAKFDFWMKAPGGVKFEIKDAKGTLVNEISAFGHAGLNRILWDWRPSADRRLPNRGEEENFLFVPAGKYQVTLTVSGQSQMQTVTVLPHPYDNPAAVGKPLDEKDLSPGDND